jgi:hypothetical protein
LKKPIIAILLLLFLLAPLGGTYYALKKKKKMVRKEVKWKIIEGIDKSELVLLSFDKNETSKKLKWKHSKEFQFEGEMYDIVEKSETEDSIHYWCWWDSEETQLNRSLKNIVSKTFQKDPFNHSQQEKLLQYFKSIYIVKSIDSDNILQGSKKLAFAGNSISPYQVWLSPETPPPDFITTQNL